VQILKTVVGQKSEEIFNHKQEIQQHKNPNKQHKTNQYTIQTAQE
jgi:hypothetical protein